ncbi:MAG: hypothetical protein AAF599_00050 [Bacteroidota bacterium]
MREAIIYLMVGASMLYFTYWKEGKEKKKNEEQRQKSINVMKIVDLTNEALELEKGKGNFRELSFYGEMELTEKTKLAINSIGLGYLLSFNGYESIIKGLERSNAKKWQDLHA